MFYELKSTLKLARKIPGISKEDVDELDYFALILYKFTSFIITSKFMTIYDLKELGSELIDTIVDDVDKTLRKVYGIIKEKTKAVYEKEFAQFIEKHEIRTIKIQSISISSRYIVEDLKKDILLMLKTNLYKRMKEQLLYDAKDEHKKELKELLKKKLKPLFSSMFTTEEEEEETTNSSTDIIIEEEIIEKDLTEFTNIILKDGTDFSRKVTAILDLYEIKSIPKRSYFLKHSNILLFRNLQSNLEGRFLKSFHILPEPSIRTRFILFSRENHEAYINRNRNAQWKKSKPKPKRKKGKKTKEEKEKTNKEKENDLEKLREQEYNLLMEKRKNMKKGNNQKKRINKRNKKKNERKEYRKDLKKKKDLKRKTDEKKEKKKKKES